MSSLIREIIDRIEQKKSQLDQYCPLPLRMRESFHRAARLELTYHSNAIEGNTLTLAETTLVIEERQNIADKNLREIYEAKNHDRAIGYIEQLVGERRDLGEKELLRLHEIILTNIDDTYAGRYRDVPVRIGGSRLILPNPLKVPLLMADWIEKFSYPRDHWLIDIALRKYEFLSIHPFSDGNGRTSRLIWNYFLLQHGYPLTSITIEKRSRYMNTLAEMNEGQTENYLIFMLESIERSLDIYLDALQ